MKREESKIKNNYVGADPVSAQTPQRQTLNNVGVVCYVTQRGITLISLVITIIILLILAGVTINFVVGENGIFKLAEESTELYQNKVEQEKNEIAKIDDYVMSHRDNENIYHIEKGTKTVTYRVSAWQYTTIYFENTYNEIPEVYYNCNAGTTGGSVYIREITNTSFTIGYSQLKATGHITDDINWIAIGK